MNNQILEFLESQNLDIRQRGKNPASRFIDQKVTPDVLSGICNCILSLNRDIFISKDIWNSESFYEMVTLFFGKEAPDNQYLSNEYDKFISQSINMLNFSGIIEFISKKSNSNQFQIKNKILLSFIASSDKNAFKFLIMYLIEVLKQSNLYNIFEKFLKNSEKKDSDFQELKIFFDKYMKKYTNISNSNFYETKRMFTKVINPLALKEKTYGGKNGHLSKTKIIYNDLLYNKINFRDINKPKDMSREEFKKLISNQSTYKKNLDYSISKAKSSIKCYHKLMNNDMLESEIYTPELTTAFHVHHIFPKSGFEEISDTLENLIILTPSQHLSFAHENGNTHSIDKNFQKICLIAKLKTILFSKYSKLYNLRFFIDVLNIGLGTIIPSYEKEQILLEDKNIIFDYISDKIKNHY